MSAAARRLLDVASGVDIGSVSPQLLAALEQLARRHGRILITSGYRSIEKQRTLWNGAPGNGLVRGVSVAPPGGSLHQAGAAVDATIDGRPITEVVSTAELRAVGLHGIGPRDAVHVQLYPAGTSSRDARAKLGQPIDPRLKAPGITDALDRAGGAASDAAQDAVRAVLGSLWDSVRADAMRATLYVVLVAAGLAAAVYGLSKMLGADDLVRAGATRTMKGAAVAAMV